MRSFTPFPTLNTGRLILRQITAEDAEDIFRMRSDPQMHLHTDTIPDATIEDSTQYITRMDAGIDENKWLIWAIEHRQDRRVIGSISLWNFNAEELSAELGYGIIPSYQNQGFMKEALSAVVCYGFNTLNLLVINAYTEDNNTSSSRLLVGVQFEHTGTVVEPGHNCNRDLSMAIYSRRKQ